MTRTTWTSLLVVVGACLALAGCGSDDERGDPIPSQTASALLDQLDSVQARIDNGSLGACEDVLGGPRGPNVPAVEELINGLPQRVDEDVRSALERGFQRLFELVQERCEELRAQQEEEVTPPETDTVETITETTPTETVETTPPETDTQTTPTEEQPGNAQPNQRGNERGGGQRQGGTPPGQSGEAPGQGNGGVIAPEDEE